MRRLSLLLAILLLNSSASAQWGQAASFQTKDELGNPYEEPVTCVYFLNLPGPPRVGFAGTESELWKTNDGGISWKKVWIPSGPLESYGLYAVTDICFKDSLTGWFSIYDGSGSTADTGCYRTTDAGESWTPIQVPGSITGSEGVYFDHITNRLFLCMTDTGMKVSTDLGDTWEQATQWYTSGLSFSSDSMGIACAFFPSDSNTGTYVTTNGGLSWKAVYSHIWGAQPLAIPGTPICFAVDAARIIVRRSDDYGATWKIVADFGPVQDSNFKDIAPYGTGVIRGDLSRLLIQTDSGTFISTDQGVTWRNDGGPAFLSDGGIGGRFYIGNGIAMAGSILSSDFYEGNGLWEETWPQSAGVAEQEPSSNTLRIFPNPAFNSITVEPAAKPVTIYDPLGRVYKVPIHGATLDISSLPAGVYYLSDGFQRTKFVKE